MQEPYLRLFVAWDTKTKSRRAEKKRNSFSDYCSRLFQMLQRPQSTNLRFRVAIKHIFTPAPYTNTPDARRGQYIVIAHSRPGLSPPTRMTGASCKTLTVSTFTPIRPHLQSPRVTLWLPSAISGETKPCLCCLVWGAGGHRPARAADQSVACFLTY